MARRDEIPGYLQGGPGIQGRIAECMLDPFARVDPVSRHWGVLRMRHAALRLPDVGLPAANKGRKYHSRDYSFASQMDAVINNPASFTDGAITTPPDVFLFTVRSAVPVGDAVRGYYEALGQETPILGPINALSNGGPVAKEHVANVLWGKTAPSTTGAFVEKLAHAEAEVKRLTPLLTGVKHVCVIDQYADSSVTLLLGGLIAQKAGAKHVTGIRGLWYGGVREGEYNVAGLTSSYADFMRDIGRQAAAKTLTPPPVR